MESIEEVTLPFVLWKWISLTYPCNSDPRWSLKLSRQPSSRAPPADQLTRAGEHLDILVVGVCDQDVTPGCAGHPLRIHELAQASPLATQHHQEVGVTGDTTVLASWAAPGTPPHWGETGHTHWSASTRCGLSAPQSQSTARARPRYCWWLRSEILVGLKIFVCSKKLILKYFVPTYMNCWKHVFDVTWNGFRKSNHNQRL